jgi:hypothetical protein
MQTENQKTLTSRKQVRMGNVTTNKNDVLIIHVWPEPSNVGRALCPDCKPISHEREDDVWDRLRDLTTNPNVRRNILVMTCSHQFAEDQRDVLDKFRADNCMPDRIKFLEPHKEKRTKWHAKTKREEEVEVITPFTLSCSTDAKEIANYCLSKNYSALLIWNPTEFNLQYLSHLKEQGVRTPIYVFHNSIHEEKWGVEIDGDEDRAYRKTANWEDAFPALADVEFSPQEVIVDDMLIGGNIHLLSAPPESYKTMQLIELSSAVLEQRPVFDLLKVNTRYPIMFLCADMSQEQFDFYAAPFNLRKHGGDLRVMKCGDGIPNITDPVLQKAVKGRILILDTMLDFAHIQKAFESGEWNTFMENLRFLMTNHGCVAVVMTAHTTRAEVKSDSDTINKAEYFKDSVTFHGKTDIGFGCKVLKNTSQVKIERIKGRGFKKKYFSFTIAVHDEEGNSNLDRGRFPVCTLPEDMKEMTEQRKAQAGRKPDPQLNLKMELAAKTPGSFKDKAEAVNAEYQSNHQPSTIKKWFDKKEFDQEAE